MTAIVRRSWRWIAVGLVFLGLGGCGPEGSRRSPRSDLLPNVPTGPTIGSVAQIAMPEPTDVEGYGLVGGLPGTGTRECPTTLRAYLKDYLRPETRAGLDLDKLIDSPETAVVWLAGQIAPAASRDRRFDVRLGVANQEGASLQGGWLYKAELRLKGTLELRSSPVAIVAGPVFIDTMTTSGTVGRQGYVLGGGQVIRDYSISAVLRPEDYRLANQIRNRLNGRFGPGVAQAISPGQVLLKVPARYEQREIQFVKLVQAVPLDEMPQAIDALVTEQVHALAVDPDKEAAEIALEAIGRTSLTKLGVLLGSSNEEVRLRAGRCMLNLESSRGLEPLRQIALDPNSTRRIEALRAVGAGARVADASALGRRLLRDPDVGVLMAAYEQLRKLGDVSVRRELIGGRFVLEQIEQTPHRAIFVSRKDEPKIVLFGAPLVCRDDVFVQTDGGEVVVNSRPGQPYVLSSRRHPSLPMVIGPVQSWLDVGDITRALGDERAPGSTQGASGLGLSYDVVVALLKQLCETNAVDAEFWVGPLPKIGRIVKR